MDQNLFSFSYVCCLLYADVIFFRFPMHIYLQLKTDSPVSHLNICTVNISHLFVQQ